MVAILKKFLGVHRGNVSELGTWYRKHCVLRAEHNNQCAQGSLLVPPGPRCFPCPCKHWHPLLEASAARPWSAVRCLQLCLAVALILDDALWSPALFFLFISLGFSQSLHNNSCFNGLPYPTCGIFCAGLFDFRVLKQNSLVSVWRETEE